jgi:hypothetical protein
LVLCSQPLLLLKALLTLDFPVVPLRKPALRLEPPSDPAPIKKSTEGGGPSSGSREYICSCFSSSDFQCLVFVVYH